MFGKYIKGDWQKVAVQKEQVEEALQFAHCFDDINAYSLYDDDGKIYAIFGWQKIDEDRGDCFALLGENCRYKLLEIIRFFNKEIPLVMRQYHLCRAYMTIKKDFVPAVRLAKFLGFYQVADLPSFFLDSDYQLFERKL